MANMRTVAFARVSSKAQEDEGYSLDAQLKLIRRYCKDNKLQIVSEFRISETASKNEQRSVFRQMLVHISKNNAAHLVVEKTDRLTRNLRDAVVIDDWLENNDQRRLHMVKENLVIHKHAKSDAKLMWNIYLAFAKKYTDNLREEAMKGWDEKLAQGWMPAPPPPGYKSVTENSKKIHVINEETAPVVENGFRLYLQSGQTISTITDEFAECGLVTSKGRPLAKSTVHRMLRNPFYIGVISFNKREYPGAHEPLVSTELFNAVQVKLGEHHKKQISHNPLFKGLIQCADCRKMVTWQLQKGRYYGACQRRQEACKHYRMIREDYLENLIGARLHKVDIADKKQIVFNRLKQVIESGRQPYIGQHRLQVMKLIARQLLRCEAMEANLYEDKIADAIDAIAYQTKMSEISERRKQLKSRLHKIEAVEGKTNVCGIDATNVTDLYGSESKAGKRQILSTIFRIRLDGGRVRIENI